VLPRSRSPLVAAALVAVSAHLAAEVVSVIAVAEEDLAVEALVAARHSEQEVDREAASEETEVVVEASLLVEDRVALEVAVVAEVAVATKCLASHLDTQKGAKHEGVNRQRRHGVMKPMDGLGKWFSQGGSSSSCFTLYRTTHFEIQRQRGAQKNYFNFHSFGLYLFLCYTYR
jgi:hypothetical protein